MKYINLTAHPINILSGGITIPPSGIVARTHYHTETILQENGIPIVRFSYSNIYGLPKSEDNTIYIVSSVVLNAVREQQPERNDVVAPMKPVRDANGKVIGCMGFRCNG